MSELGELHEPDSGGRSSRSTQFRIPALFRFVGLSAFFFCWGVIGTIPKWDRRVPLSEFDDRIPVRGFGNFYIDPWFGLTFYASAVISEVYVLLQVIADSLRKAAMTGHDQGS